MSKLSEINKSKTHCAKGHAYTPENTQIVKGKNRVCKTCKKASFQNSYIKKVRKTPEQRFFAKVLKTESCWNWKASKAGGKNSDYGVFWDGERMTYSHRFSYEFHKGKIPENLQIDHLCRNRDCVNPDHLEAVTQKENLHRGVGPAVENLKKTHCKRGHEFTPENTIIVQKNRRCRTCYNKYMRNFVKNRRPNKRAPIITN